MDDADLTWRERRILGGVVKAQNTCLERIRARVDALHVAGSLTPRALLHRHRLRRRPDDATTRHALLPI